MLRLKNILIGPQTSEADFLPEESEVAGHIVVDMQKGELLSCVRVEGYGASYTGHAMQQILKMAKENDTRTECLVMWY